MVCMDRPSRPKAQLEQNIWEIMEKRVKIGQKLLKAAGKYYANKHLMSLECNKFIWGIKSKEGMMPLDTERFYKTEKGEALKRKVSEKKEKLEKAKKKALEVMEKDEVDGIEEMAKNANEKIVNSAFGAAI